MNDNRLKDSPNAIVINNIDNYLSPNEISKGWRFLWDGISTNGWRGAKIEDFPENGWEIKDSILTVLSSDGKESQNGGDIVTVKKFSDFELELERYINDNVGTLVVGINDTTKAKIQNVINNSFGNGEGINSTGNEIRNAIIGMGVLRANLIARTEVHRTASFANEMVAENMGIAGTRKEWVAVADGRTRATHIQATGQQVGLEEPFIVGGDRLKYPGDPAGSPGAVSYTHLTLPTKA